MLKMLCDVQLMGSAPAFGSPSVMKTKKCLSGCCDASSCCLAVLRASEKLVLPFAGCELRRCLTRALCGGP